MESHPQQLPMPPQAKQDPQAQEMIRAWIASQGLNCSLRIGLWQDRNMDETQTWGLLLADLARQVANAIQESEGLDQKETLRIIQETFLAEMAKPSPLHGVKYGPS